MTSVLHECRDFSRYQIYDGKEIAIQILNEPPTESEMDREQSYLVMVKAWDPSDWSLSECVEVFIPKTATMHEMGVLI